MLKKILHKRKIKHFGKQILFISLLFLGTFFILFSLYLPWILSHHKLASPLALIEKTLHTTPSHDQNTKIIQKLLENNTILFSEIIPSENNTTRIVLKDGQDVIITNTKSLEQQIASLQLIMRQLTIEGKRFN